MLCNIDPIDRKDIRKVLLRQFYRAFFSILRKEIEQVTEFDKRIVIPLMGGFVQQQIDVHCVALEHKFVQAAVHLEHPVKIFPLKFQRVHSGDRTRHNGHFNFELGIVATGVDGTFSGKQKNLLPPVFMLYKSNGNAGLDVVDPFNQFSRFPQVISRLKMFFSVGLGEKILVQFRVIGRVIVAR